MQGHMYSVGGTHAVRRRVTPSEIILGKISQQIYLHK